MSTAPDDLNANTRHQAPGRSRGLGRQIVDRTLAGLWRQKNTLILGAGVLAGLASYSLFVAPGVPSAALASAVSSSAGDCADTAVAALVQRSPATLQQAYQCLDPSVQQQLSEQQFASQLQRTTTPSVTRVDRVATYRETDGATLVYYALDGGSQSVGCIIYLGPDGKVLRIE